MANPDVCTTCSVVTGSNRKSSAFNCVCKTAHYDAGVPVCAECAPACSACENPSDCSACLYSGDNRLSTPTCVCAAGFVEDDAHNCVSSNPATSCPVEEGRGNDEDCLCIGGYYEDALEVC